MIMDMMEHGARLVVGSLSDADGQLSLVPHATVIVVLVGSAIAFHCLNVALNFTPVLEKRDREIRFRWRNIVTSFIHAVISGFSACYCLYSSPELLEDIKQHVTTISIVLVALSVGYFVYDLADILISRPIRTTWPLAIHHVVICFCFGISLHLRAYIGYAVVALVAETNSIFLHLRQILLIMGVPKSAPIYRVNGAVNIATYLIFRFGTLFWMFYWLQSHRTEVPLTLYTIAAGGLVIMIVINLVLFKRLLVSDFLSPGDKLKKDKNVLEK
ncbi:TLC domain-containing protein 2-like [Acanthaster planci]|uniref:TLC domain-containing protein 2-like n=1 Tax=Acanthaster planci TaxID=133434 RepID=A0A8B7ZXM7_ACAPL|nr:TLC domain-containing protein 2-like [Acanthaster planci]